MKCPAFAAVIAIFLTSCNRSNTTTTMEHADETPGFQEVLKDGEKREQAFAMMSPQGLSNVSDDDLAVIIRGYVNSQRQSADYWKVVELLKTNRERLIPLFLKVALEPGSESRPPELSKEILHETPLKRALTYLPLGENTELLPRLLALSESDAPFVRRDIAAHLAAYGSDDVIPAVISFLSSPDAPVAWAAMRGISTALKEGRATPLFRTGLFDPIAELNRRGTTFGNTQGDLLLALDMERAPQVLLNLLQGNDLRSYHALEALNRAKIDVAPEILHGILHANRNPPAKQLWRCSFFGSALLALARQKDPIARSEIDRLLKGEGRIEKVATRRFENINLQLQEGASNALLAWENFTVPELWDRHDQLGRERVSEVERDLLSMADAEVCNGGFSQYFFNIDYDPREDVETMKRLGAVAHAAILKQSFKAFGWRGPDADRQRRIEQLEKMSNRESEILSQCDEDWFSSTESLTVLSNLYALKHRAQLEAIRDGSVMK